MFDRWVKELIHQNAYIVIVIIIANKKYIHNITYTIQCLLTSSITFSQGLRFSKFNIGYY